MSERIRIWWTQLTTREQRLVLVMLALMAVVLVWVVILWIGNSVSDARRRHGLAVIEYAQVAGKVEALKDLRRNAPAPIGTPLETIVSQSASEVGFVPGRIEGEGGDRVSLSIASARPTALFGWIADLETRGIFPERLVARANSDRTIAVEMTLRARGS